MDYIINLSESTFYLSEDEISEFMKIPPPMEAFSDGGDDTGDSGDDGDDGIGDDSGDDGGDTDDSGDDGINDSDVIDINSSDDTSELSDANIGDIINEIENAPDDFTEESSELTSEEIEAALAELENECEPSDIDWSKTCNTEAELAIIRDMAESGELSVSEVDENLREPEPGTKHLPSNSGIFSDERGNSSFTPFSEEALEEMAKYGVDSIEYINNDPDFSPVSIHDSPWGELDSTVKIGHMTTHRENGPWEFGTRPSGTSHDPNYDLGNFAQADNELAKKLEGDVTGKDIEDYRIANNLTWHELSDGTTMMLVPNAIHSACIHSGGVSEMGYRMACGDVSLNDE